MEFISLGRSGLIVSRTSFGALPIQRVENMEQAVSIIQRAYEGGINFFDTARMYSDSEKKLGYAFYNIRKNVVIASKTTALNPVAMRKDLETSLDNLQTDYIDLYQLHNPPFVSKPGSEDGVYDALVTEKHKGKIRHIGITTHSIKIAQEAIKSGVYDTIQFPFSLLSTQEDIEIVELCKQNNIGFIAMKALCGGLIKNITAAFAWLRQYESVIPIWGIQHIEELEEFLALESNPPELTEALLQAIEVDRRELSGNFCRGCGYCLPCPVGIPINNTNRMSQLLRRSPVEGWLTQQWQNDMEKISLCTKCGQCEKKCPYHLKPYETLPLHLEDYKKHVDSFISHKL